jgi:hypothetical protein
MSRRSQLRLKRLAQVDLEYCHVDDDYDEINSESLTEHYGSIQRRQPNETEYSNA